jgi:hypothetical protein
VGGSSGKAICLQEETVLGFTGASQGRRGFARFAIWDSGFVALRLSGGIGRCKSRKTNCSSFTPAVCRGTKNGSCR